MAGGTVWGSLPAKEASARGTANVRLDNCCGILTAQEPRQDGSGCRMVSGNVRLVHVRVRTGPQQVALTIWQAAEWTSIGCGSLKRRASLLLKMPPPRYLMARRRAGHATLEDRRKWWEEGERRGPHPGMLDSTQNPGWLTPYRRSAAPALPGHFSGWEPEREGHLGPERAATPSMWGESRARPLRQRQRQGSRPGQLPNQLSHYQGTRCAL